jgi:surfactin synthase thioesterase subunit
VSAVRGPAWLAPWHSCADVDAVLLCLPPAGSGCGQFAGWQRELGASVAAVGVQLPGREQRFAEPMPATVDDAVAAIASEVVARLPAGAPLVLYGQSFGGLLAYELCRCLHGVHGRPPAALVVAACRAPHHWVGAGRGLVEDGAELERLLDLRGLGDDLDPDSRELMLEVLRVDAQLSLTYADPAGAPVPCPLHAWGGTRDEIVTAGQLDEWAAYAGGPFERRQFPGSHYLSADAGLLLVEALRGLLLTADVRSPSKGD